MGDFSILALRIKELRKSLNTTQKDFSAHVGCTAATLSAYENGSKSPSLEIIKSIAEKCHVSIDWLCGLSTEINFDGSIKTYGDAIRLLLKLEEKLDIAVSIVPVEFNLADNPTKFAYSINFGNHKMQNFINEWEKMKALHDNFSIDDDLYDLWIEKTIKKYDAFLTVGDGWENKNTAE